MQQTCWWTICVFSIVVQTRASSALNHARDRAAAREEHHAHETSFELVVRMWLVFNAPPCMKKTSRGRADCMKQSLFSMLWIGRAGTATSPTCMEIRRTSCLYRNVELRHRRHIVAATSKEFPRRATIVTLGSKHRHQLLEAEPTSIMSKSFGHVMIPALRKFTN